jgi:hypothetical protein
MKLKNYIKYVSILAISAMTLSVAFVSDAQVLTGNSTVKTLVDNVKTIAVPNCDYGAKNTTGSFSKDTIGYIVGKSVTYKCIDGVTVEFLNVVFQTGSLQEGSKTPYRSSLGYVNSKAVKVSSVPTPSANTTSAALSLNDNTTVTIKPLCIPKSSNEAGKINKGLIGTVINANVNFICPDKSVINLAYVRFTAGTGVNRDTVEGYVFKSEIKITSFDSTQKSNIMVAVPKTNVDILYKPVCKTPSKVYNANVYANASSGAIGNVIGSAYKIKCNGVFETFYNVGFPRDAAQVEGEYLEGYINSKNVTLTPIGVTNVPEAVKTVANYKKALYKSPNCAFVTGSDNDLGSELGVPRPAINGKIVGELTLTCGTVKNTFYKVIFSYNTSFEFHEGVTGYIKSTDL